MSKTETCERCGGAVCYLPAFGGSERVPVHSPFSEQPKEGCVARAEGTPVRAYPVKEPA